MGEKVITIKIYFSFSDNFQDEQGYLDKPKLAKDEVIKYSTARIPESNIHNVCKMIGMEGYIIPDEDKKAKMYIPPHKIERIDVIWD